jgi:hypothetical protein
MNRKKATAKKKVSAKKKFKGARRKGTNMNMITDRFDVRTLANMEVALERACQYLRMERDAHEARRHIAKKIVERAEGGDKTLTGLTRAGRIAATELSTARAKPR